MVLSLVLALATPAFACDGAKSTAKHTDTETAAKHASGSGEKKSCGLPAAETTAALPASGSKVAIAVTGMHCGGCANTVHAALMKVDGVTGAQVDLATGNVQVAYDAAKANPDGLLAALAPLSEFKAALVKP